MTAGYLGSFWNAYLSPTTGGELFVLAEHAAGHLPYRDSYLASQPLPFLLPFLLEPVFGRRLIVVWAAGALLRLAAAVCAYLWLARLTKPWIAVAATVTAFVVASGDVADTPAFYNHVSVCAAVIGTYLGWLAASEGRGRLAATGAGVFLATAFLTKQTTGLLVPATVVPLLLALAAVRRGRRGVLGLGGGFALGALLMLAPTYGWLWRNGLLEPYARQVFLRASSSKGGLAATLARPFVQPFTLAEFGAAPAVGLVAAGFLVAFALSRRCAAERPASRVAPELAVALPLLGAILLGRVPRAGGWLDDRTPLLGASFAVVVGCLLLAAIALVAVVRGRGASSRDFSVLVLAGLGFSSAYALSISWAIFEVMAFPGLAVLLALSLSGLEGGRARSVARAGTLLLCLVLVAVGASRKRLHPFSWVWTEPPLSESTQASTLPELSGFVLSPSTVEALEGVTALVRRFSTPGEKIWVYPAMPVFYGLADRRPATFAVHHWIDVCPDDIARADAARVLAEPPPVIVAQLWSSRSIAALEGVFRGGQASGQMELLGALKQLLPRYSLVGTFSSAAATPCPPIHVFVLRRDAPSPPAISPPQVPGGAGGTSREGDAGAPSRSGVR